MIISKINFIDMIVWIYIQNFIFNIKNYKMTLKDRFLKVYAKVLLFYNCRSTIKYYILILILIIKSKVPIFYKLLNF